MIRKAFLLATAAMISAPAAAAAATPAQPGAKPDPQDKIICKFINTTGSRISHDRECRTRAEWDRVSDATRDDMEHQEKRATGDATNAPH